VAVTFDGDCVEEDPSLRFLLPGKPLFSQLVSIAFEVSDVALGWSQYGPVSSSTGDYCEEGGSPKGAASLYESDGQRVVLDETEKSCQ